MSALFGAAAEQRAPLRPTNHCHRRLAHASAATLRPSKWVQCNVSRRCFVFCFPFFGARDVERLLTLSFIHSRFELANYPPRPPRHRQANMNRFPGLVARVTQHLYQPIIEAIVVFVVCHPNFNFTCLSSLISVKSVNTFTFFSFFSCQFVILTWTKPQLFPTTLTAHRGPNNRFRVCRKLLLMNVWCYIDWSARSVYNNNSNRSHSNLLCEALFAKLARSNLDMSRFMIFLSF